MHLSQYRRRSSREPQPTPYARTPVCRPSVRKRPVPSLRCRGDTHRHGLLRTDHRKPPSDRTHRTPGQPAGRARAVAHTRRAETLPTDGGPAPRGGGCSPLWALRQRSRSTHAQARGRLSLVPGRRSRSSSAPPTWLRRSRATVFRSALAHAVVHPLRRQPEHPRA